MTAGAFEIVALACAGLFGGAALYITLVEHPARVSCGSAVAVAQFRPSYRRAAPIQASLAVVGFLASVLAWWETRDVRLLAAGVLLVSVVPLTLIVILPTNKRLLDPALDVSSEEASALLDRWGRLHAIRTIAGLLAFAILLARLAG